MLKLTAEKRERFGKQLKKERIAGRLPVIMYGRKVKPQPLFVKLQEFKKVFAQAGESSIITVKNAAGEERALIHEVAFHPVTDEPIHADLYVVEKDVALRVAVPIEFIGVSAAVKELGGTLVKVLHELAVEALPQDLPHVISVDLATLVTLDSQIVARDLVWPKGVKILNEPAAVVASVTVAKAEPVEEALPLDLAAIEVEKRGKVEVADEGSVAPAGENQL